MRLGQLARKLALPPSEITAFLASQDITIVDGTNTRLEENQVSLVLQRFAPELLNSSVNTEVDEPEETPIVSLEKPVEQPVAIEAASAEENQVEDQPSDQTGEPGEIELIKAPKVQLSGLKVLGKIELPEKKKKPEPEVGTPEASATEIPTDGTKPEEKPQRERRRPEHKRREQRDQRPRKNPIALEREREAQAAEEKKKEELRLKKERQTQNYMNRVQAKAPTKAARINREDTIDMSSVDLRPAPKTWLGRFWKWFRS